MFFKPILTKIKMLFCMHKFYFLRTDVIGCQRVSIHLCAICGKKKYISFARGLENIERYFNVKFD